MRSIISSFFILVGVSLSLLNAQVRPEHVCKVITNASLSASAASTCTPVFETHYNNAPIINVYVNVHIWNSNENLSNAVLVSRVRQMIQVCNETLDNMQQNFRNAPNGQPAPRVEDAKFRLKLYSEATNTADVNGGIWVYPQNMWTWSGSILNYNVGSFPGYTNHYNNNVVNVLFLNFEPHLLGTQRSAINSAWTTLGGGNLVVAADLNGAFRADQLNGTTNQDDLIWRSIARALNHEVGHILNLEHTYECGEANGCLDIDINGECGSVCPGEFTCGGSNNGGACSNGTPICTYGSSHNIVSNSWWQNAITRCQWERWYEFAINTNFNFIRDCPSVANLTLTTSPNIDYRASSTITSTSTIASARDVTYQAPTIVMNGGFQVDLGASFLASPSTFPCCDPPTSFQASGEELSLLEEKTLAWQNESFKIFPVPFENQLTIQASKLRLPLNHEQLNVQLIDVNGRIVQSTVMDASSAELTLNVANTLPGQYWVRVVGKSTYYTYRAIKL